MSMKIRRTHLIPLALFLLLFLAAGESLLAVLDQLAPLPQMVLMADPADAGTLRVARGSAKQVETVRVGLDAYGNFQLPAVPGLDTVPVMHVRPRADNGYDFVQAGLPCRVRPFPFLANDGIPMPSVVTCRRVDTATWLLVALAAAGLAGVFTWWVRRSDGIVLQTLGFARRHLGRRDLAGLAGFGLWAAYVSTGGDIPTIQENVSLAARGVNIHQFQMQLEALTGWLAKGGLPMLPYPPAAIAAILPVAEIGRLFHFLAAPLNMDPAKFQQMAVVLAVWLTYCLTVLAFLRLFAELALCPAGQVRRVFYWTVFNPFLLFVLIIFGQIDVISVLLLALGLAALLLDGRPAVAALLGGLATLIKVQHLFLLPLLLLLAFYRYRRDAAWLPRFLSFFAVLAGLAGLSVWVQQTVSPDFIALAEINPQIDRVDQALFEFGPGVGLLSVHFLVPMVMVAMAGVWPARAAAAGHLAMFSLMLGAVAGLFQIGFLSTPGMYAFLILPVMAWLVAEEDAGKRLVFSVLSVLGTLSWSVSSVGDITRVVAVGQPGAITEYLRGLDREDVLHHSSVVLSLERAWIFALVLLAVWSTWRLLATRSGPR
jgi:hypothetical protein